MCGAVNHLHGHIQRSPGTHDAGILAVCPQGGQIRSSYGKVPLVFEANKGQTD